MVFSRASGCSVWDPEGKKYIDFLSAYSAVNQAKIELFSSHQQVKLRKSYVDSDDGLSVFNLSLISGSLPPKDYESSG